VNSREENSEDFCPNYVKDCTLQCGSVGCSVAQLVAHWLAVRQARARISARHPMEVPPTEPTAVKIWRWASANVYE
jgi:hypothetical protein